MSIKSSWLGRRALIALAVAAIACGGGGGDGTNVVEPPAQPTLATITVTLAASTTTPGQQVQATAAGATQNGTAVTLSNVSWTTTQPSVATVNSAGLVTAVGPGTTQVTATVGGVTGSATLTVT